MKVLLIGTGSMHNEYNSASFLIDDDIVIDMPNGICKNLYRVGIDPSTINYVLLTHFHGDHYFDVPFYLLRKSKDNNKKCKIYLSKDGIKKCKKLLIYAFKNPAKDILKTVKPPKGNKITLSIFQENKRPLKILSNSWTRTIIEKNKKSIILSVNKHINITI